MIQEVTSKTLILQQHSLKRKTEEERLNKEKQQIELKKKEIEDLKRTLQ